jgi:hypothetical protein
MTERFAPLKILLRQGWKNALMKDTVFHIKPVKT